MTCYVSQGLKVRGALKIAGISKHQYYYRSKGGKRGVKPSTHTPKYVNGDWIKITNEQVIMEIEAIKKDPDLDGGYENITQVLRQEGYRINPKKTNRLMKDHNLLKDKRQKQPRNYVKYRKVLPTQPLEVLEMDIKMQWVERDRRHAYVLNIVDTFSRKWLYHWVGFSVTQHQVKAAWQYIIAEYLQPNDCLKRAIHIEIRNDNDKRFSAKMVQDFFKENNLNQVFTHPYTPQENAHIESFHNILSQRLKRFTFWNLEQLEQNLLLYQEKYNNQRLHGSIAHLTPNDFECLYHKGYIQTQINEKQRIVKFKPLIEHWLIKQIAGNDEPEGSLLHDFVTPKAEKKSNQKEMNGANISNNSRSKESPSVVSCSAKLSEDFCSIVNPN